MFDGAAPEAAPTASSRPPLPDRSARLAEVRKAVRTFLESTEAFRALDTKTRSKMARDMVRLGDVALSLMAEEDDALGDVAANASSRSPPLFAQQQAGGVQGFDPRSNRQLGRTARGTLDQVSFPRFVSELIDGVFRAIGESNVRQMESYVSLINSVSVATEDMDGETLGPMAARSWLAQRFPESYEISASGSDLWGEGGGAPVIRVKDGAEPPSQGALRGALGLEDGASVTGHDPESSLLPLARAQLARNRQQMLATLVMMGMQRLVVEHGRITAGMRFHIDAHTAAQEDNASRFEFGHSMSGSASFGVGPWGVSAAARTTIGYVKTNRTAETEEMNQALDLNANVELHFRNDFLPLNNVANEKQVERIQSASLNPDAFAPAQTQTRSSSANSARQQTGRTITSTPIISHQPATAPTPPGQSGNQRQTAGQRQPQQRGGRTGGGQPQSRPGQTQPRQGQPQPRQGQGQPQPRQGQPQPNQGQPQPGQGRRNAPQSQPTPGQNQQAQPQQPQQGQPTSP